MFDTAEITVRAGDGGSGAISFRHEKYVPFGGPDGGDGGRGGDVIMTADSGISNLLEFRRRAFYRASRGRGGRGSKKHGARGENLVLRVPMGTIIMDGDTPAVLVGDLEEHGQSVVVAHGGSGGQGNTHFASSTNQVPRIAQKGDAGEEKALRLELRLIADVGIIGYPNVGKSTLLAAASAAHPRIAGYPFTTREPVLGVVEVGVDSFVLAEIPGLIDGAHLGRGLGHDFLRHATRTRLFIHLVDGTSSSPVEDMIRVNTELGLFDASLAQRQQIVAVNKIDLPEVHARTADIQEAFGSMGIPSVFVSASTGVGVAALISRANDLLKETQDTGKKVPDKVFRPAPRREAITVQRQEDIFVVSAPALERIVTGGDLSSPDVRWQWNRQLARLGIDRALEKAGARPGDRVRCGDLEWDW